MICRAVFVLTLASLGALLGAARVAGAQEQEAMLSSHNEYRMKHCTPPMQWSQQFAQSAAKWAQGCSFSHSASGSPDRPRNEGENIYMAWPSGGPNTTAAAAVNSWYDEVKHYNFSAPVWSPSVGHFTQVVWVASTTLGCGKAVCKKDGHDWDFWVCRYSPPGNWNVNQPGELAKNVRQACR